MKKTIISIFAAVIALASCQNLDFSRTDQVAASNVWGKATLARQAVNGIYSEFYVRNCRTDNEDNWAVMFEAYSSVMDTDKNWYENQKVCYGDGTPASGQIASMFQYYYTFVFRANDVISHIGQVPDMSDEEKAKFIAEAKFFRAYAYYNLNVLWRGVPLYMEYIEDEKELAEVAKGKKGILVVEINAGQMIEDVSLAIEGRKHVGFFERLGGMVPMPEEIENAFYRQFGL